MARVIEFVDVPISEDRDITFEAGSKILGFALSNHGTVNVNHSLGNTNKNKVLRPDDSVEYGNINVGAEPAYITGTLSISCATWASAVLILTYCYERNADETC